MIFPATTETFAAAHRQAILLAVAVEAFDELAAAVQGRAAPGFPWPPDIEDRLVTALTGPGASPHPGDG